MRNFHFDSILRATQGLSIEHRHDMIAVGKCGKGMYTSMAKRGRKQPSQQQQQPYDNTLKSLIEGHEQEMLPLFLQGAVFLAVLN